MKIVPCPSCKREALGPATPDSPGGTPVLMGRYTGGRHPVVVRCWRCQRAFKVDAITFNGWPSIPEATPEAP